MQTSVLCILVLVAGATCASVSDQIGQALGNTGSSNSVQTSNLQSSVGVPADAKLSLELRSGLLSDYFRDIRIALNKLNNQHSSNHPNCSKEVNIPSIPQLPNIPSSEGLSSIQNFSSLPNVSQILDNFSASAGVSAETLNNSNDSTGIDEALSGALTMIEDMSSLLSYINLDNVTDSISSVSMPDDLSKMDDSDLRNKIDEARKAAANAISSGQSDLSKAIQLATKAALKSGDAGGEMANVVETILYKFYDVASNNSVPVGTVIMQECLLLVGEASSNVAYAIAMHPC